MQLGMCDREADMQQLIDAVDTHKQELSMEAAKITPPAVAAGMTLAGYPLSDWLVLLTIIYTILQIWATSHRLWRERQERIKCKLEKDNVTTRSKP